MIKLNFTKSSHSEILGNLQIFRNTLQIGRSFKADIILRDKNISKNSVVMYIRNEMLFIKSLSDDFLCNGKKYRGLKKVIIGDKISLQGDEFQITDFKISRESPSLNDLKDGLNSFKENHRPYLFIIEQIQHELLEAEKDSDA